MTKKERVMHFFRNEPVDRVPVAFFHHFTEPNEWLKGMVSEEIFEKNIEGHRKALTEFDPDVIKVMNDSLMIMPVDCSFVTCAADLRRLEPPKKGSPWFEKTRELTCRVLEIYKDNHAPKYVTGFAPFMILKTGLKRIDQSMGVGKPLFLQYLVEDPDSVLAALENIRESVEQLNEMLIKECGADGVYMSVNNQANFLPSDVYIRYIKPSETRMLAHLNTLSDINILHVCGYKGLGNDLEIFRDYDMPAVNWAVYADEMSLGEGKKYFGGKPVLGGFSQDGIIYKGSKAELQAEVFRILDEVGQVGVMLGDDCTVPNDIDNDRFNWVREACEKYAAGKGKLIYK